MKLSIQGQQSWLLWTVLLLMLVNWGIEAKKWQVLLNRVQRMTWWSSFKAILAGVSVGITTPNRIGEFAGRILFVQDGNRAKAVSLTAIGSLSQFIVTLVAGCGGLVCLLNLRTSATSPNPGGFNIWIYITLVTAVAASMLSLLLFFKLRWLIKIIRRVPAFVKVVSYLEVLEGLTSIVLLRILGLSLLRYMVFIFQYIFMLRLMQVDVTTWQAVWLTSVVFLVMAFVPTIALAEIGLRGKVSLEMFGMFSINSVGILAVSVGIWAINLIIPALLGSLLILRIKIFKNR